MECREPNICDVLEIFWQLHKSSPGWIRTPSFHGPGWGLIVPSVHKVYIMGFRSSVSLLTGETVSRDKVPQHQCTNGLTSLRQKSAIFNLKVK